MSSTFLAFIENLMVSFWYHNGPKFISCLLVSALFKIFFISADFSHQLRLIFGKSNTVPHIHVSDFRSGDAMEDDISAAIKFCSTNNAGHGHGGMARQKIPIWANQ